MFGALEVVCIAPTDFEFGRRASGAAPRVLNLRLLDLGRDQARMRSSRWAARSRIVSDFAAAQYKQCSKLRKGSRLARGIHALVPRLTGAMPVLLKPSLLDSVKEP